MRPRISIRGFVRPSVRPSVGPSVRPSVTPVQKPRFSAVFGHGEILHWNKWSTNMFWEPPLLLSCFTRLFVHLSLRICHMINTRRDTVRTLLCPVGLVYFLGSILPYICVVDKCRNLLGRWMVSLFSSFFTSKTLNAFALLFFLCAKNWCWSE